MKSFSSLCCALLLAVSAVGCWVPELPDDAVFSCDTAADCAAEGVVCAPRAGLRGYCCKPAAELCNGIDDDCDGQKDELSETSCYGGPEGTAGKGLCQAGRPSCGANGAVVCAGEVRPAAEACNGKDDDCDGQTDEGFNLQTDMANCGACGNACNAANEMCTAGACERRSELACGNELDDDGDGNKDCVDTDCNNQSCGTACLCINGRRGEGLCSDNADNDSDTNIDCADSDCDTKECGDGCLCQGGTALETVCNDGKDNDGNQGADCVDPDCDTKECGTDGCTCLYKRSTESNCGDQLDNDGDGSADCADYDCAYKDFGDGTRCQGGKRVEFNCNDLKDNDGDGKADCTDVDCDGVLKSTNVICSVNNTPKQTDEFLCNDNQDNDGDGNRDCGAKPSPNCSVAGGRCGYGCVLTATCASTKKETVCDDGVDNDGDNSPDCSDSDCNSTPGQVCRKSDGTQGTCQTSRACT